MAESGLSFENALDVVLSHAHNARPGRGLETAGLGDALGRVLAVAVVADRDQPPFDRATRDGYALRAGDVGRALRVVGSVRAGELWRGNVGDCEAVEIMTGAPLPAGADAVVMVEHVAIEAGVLQVEAGRMLRVGENVVPRGAEARVGDTLLPVGRVLGAAEIAVAASCGCAKVEVFARPSVAIIATGLQQLCDCGAGEGGGWRSGEAGDCAGLVCGAEGADRARDGGRSAGAVGWCVDG